MESYSGDDRLLVSCRLTGRPDDVLDCIVLFESGAAFSGAEGMVVNKLTPDPDVSRLRYEVNPNELSLRFFISPRIC